jgi:hypothetical protein
MFLQKIGELPNCRRSVIIKFCVWSTDIKAIGRPAISSVFERVNREQTWFYWGKFTSVYGLLSPRYVKLSSSESWQFFSWSRNAPWFVGYLTTLSLLSSDGKMESFMMNLELSLHDLIDVLSRNLHSGTEKNYKNFSQAIRCPFWNSNRVSPEYVSRTLPLDNHLRSLVYGSPKFIAVFTKPLIRPYSESAESSSSLKRDFCMIWINIFSESPSGSCPWSSAQKFECSSTLNSCTKVCVCWGLSSSSHYPNRLWRPFGPIHSYRWFAFGR